MTAESGKPLSLPFRRLEAIRNSTKTVLDTDSVKPMPSNGIRHHKSLMCKPYLQQGDGGFEQQQRQCISHLRDRLHKLYSEVLLRVPAVEKASELTLHSDNPLTLVEKANSLSAACKLDILKTEVQSNYQWLIAKKAE